MILVTRATGTAGRPLVELLAAEGAGVRAVTRDSKAAGLPAGVEVVEGDPSRPFGAEGRPGRQAQRVERRAARHVTIGGWTAPGSTAGCGRCGW
jgi:nucleoside-diphosphate-sugar epimerase